MHLLDVARLKQAEESSPPPPLFILFPPPPPPGGQKKTSSFQWQDRSASSMSKLFVLVLMWQFSCRPSWSFKTGNRSGLTKDKNPYCRDGMYAVTKPLRYQASSLLPVTLFEQEVLHSRAMPRSKSGFRPCGPPRSALHPHDMSHIAEFGAPTKSRQRNLRFMG